ncbi:hypothetical protein [Nonomuraea sp. NPDC050643]|uniref:hypothetical protein n=1 Tax=Nonomuraea sp. NPDC050643 TaxID=3155660 RepID=UPI0033D9DAE2
MDDLEHRLSTLLSEPQEGDPPPGLAGRIHRSVAVRRRNRRTAWLGLAACATAVTVGVAVGVPLGLGGRDAATTADLKPDPAVVTLTATSDPSPHRPTAMPEPTRTVTVTPAETGGSPTERMLRSLNALTGVTTIAGRTSSGERFTPAALGADGTVLGTTADGAVAEVSAGGGTPQPLDVTAGSGLGVDAGFRTWTEDGEQRCRTTDGATHTVSPQGADPQAPVWVDGGVIVGSDVMRQPYVAQGCAGPGRVVTDGQPAAGRAVALAYPYLFTAERANAGRLRLVDVRTGAIAAEHPLPEGVRRQLIGDPDQKWYAGASGTWFAWVADGVLRTVARDSWRPASTRAGMPAPRKGEAARLTVGDRFVAYTTGTLSIVHDPVTGTTFKSPGVVLAKGDRLLWRQGGHYRLATLTG